VTLWLGIDVGTTGSRALLIDEHGQIAQVFTAEHEAIKIEHPQWAEQSPNDWWRAARVAIRGVIRKSHARDTDICGIGLTGQMHGPVLLDGNGRVLGPSLIWCDQRSQSQVELINTRIGRDAVIRHTCNPASTGFTASKLLWVREHRPASFAKAKKLLLPKDYVRFCLTGECAQDTSDASGTGLFDVRHRCWSGDMISALGLDSGLFPIVHESTTLAGRITAKAAQETGLATGTPVVAGAGDQAAGGVGNGIVRAGLACSVIGTSGVLFAHTETPVVDVEGRIHTFCHAVPGKWHVMGVTQGAGLSLRWIRDNWPAAKGDRSYELLTQLAALAPAGSEGLVFLPYLMGERSPHLDPDARGGWIGLTSRHTTSHLVRAVLEGVAFSLRDILEIFRSLRMPIEEIRLTGGGARSALWRVIQANVFAGHCVFLPNTEAAAYGAGLLAMVGTGNFSSVEEACDNCIGGAGAIMVNEVAVRAYERLYRIYRELYSVLKQAMHELTAYERAAQTGEVESEVRAMSG
jgi:xylulokinase